MDFRVLSNTLLINVEENTVWIDDFLFVFLDSVISLQDSLMQCPIQESVSSSPSRTPPPSAGLPFF